MSFIFLDSSEYLTMGLLDEQLRWLDYEQSSVKKNSEFFHFNLHQMLERNHLELNQIEAVFQVAGPGSYTGMRLTEGFCQILNWHSIPIFSFYHFEVPLICGIEKGVWISEAFKGELFCYFWEGKKSNKKLMPKNGVETSSLVERLYADDEYVFTHYPVDGFDCEYTIDLIKKHATKLFGFIKNNSIRRESFYYRPLEVEFTVTQREK